MEDSYSSDRKTGDNSERGHGQHDKLTTREKEWNFNQTSLNLPVDIMLLSLVIVAVEITSFTVACFFSCGSIVFLLQHKIITTKKQTKKAMDKEGDKFNQSVSHRSHF